MRFARIAFSCLLLVAPLAADMLSFDSAEEVALWDKPFGLTQVGAEGQLQMAGAVIATFPVLLAYFLIQREFTEGISMSGM